MCQSMVDIQSAAAEIRRGKKKKKIERNYRMKILWSAPLHRATIINQTTFIQLCKSQNTQECKSLLVDNVKQFRH